MEVAWSKLSVAVLIARSLFPPHLLAQTVAGPLSCLGTYPSGAANSGARVVVTAIDRNVSLRSISYSYESGCYLLSGLPPGR